LLKTAGLVLEEELLALDAAAPGGGADTVGGWVNGAVGKALARTIAVDLGSTRTKARSALLVVVVLEGADDAAVVVDDGAEADPPVVAADSPLAAAAATRAF
jgi:hypothetical protein